MMSMIILFLKTILANIIIKVHLLYAMYFSTSFTQTCPPGSCYIDPGFSNELQLQASIIMITIIIVISRRRSCSSSSTRL